MKNFRKLKNNLDERQEQKLLHIEKWSFWLLYWMLLAEIFLKLLFYQDKSVVLGEMVCFMTVSIFMAVMCIKNGIWDRHIKADRKSNLLVSMVGAAAVFLINMIQLSVMIGEKAKPGSIVIISASVAVFTFLVLFGVMSVLSLGYKKRVQQLETKEDENEDSL